jgi:hypothetical protein
VNGGAEVHHELANEGIQFVHIKNGKLRCTHLNISPFRAGPDPLPFARAFCNCDFARIRPVERLLAFEFRWNARRGVRNIASSVQPSKGKDQK